jgi:hypothetical protein
MPNRSEKTLAQDRNRKRLGHNSEAYSKLVAAEAFTMLADGDGCESMAYFVGSVTRPMKSMLPERLSRIRNTNG